MAKANPFRFSTKYQDDETDLVYYGYRYYSASMGRWLSRDPIEEWGGHNLSAFVHNDPIDFRDAFGLADSPTPAPKPAPPCSHCIPENCMEAEIADFDLNSVVVTIVGEPEGSKCPPKEELPGKVKDGLKDEFKKCKKTVDCKGKDDQSRKCKCDTSQKKDYTGDWQTIEFTETYKHWTGLCKFRYTVSVRAKMKGWIAPCIGQK
jgi:RHS repeat-associated protein